MSFNELEKKRYSCRNYIDKAVSLEDINKIVNAGRISPTSRNSQPVSYYVFNSEKTVKEMRVNCQALGGNGFVENVSCFIALVVNEESFEGYLSGQTDYAGINTGIVIHAMSLEATDLGLATCMLGRFDREAVSKMIGIDEPRRILLVLAVGYSNDSEIPDKDQRRKKMEEVTFYL